MKLRNNLSDSPLHSGGDLNPSIEINKNLQEKKCFSAVVFDLGNVLIPFDHSKIVKRLNIVKPTLGDKFIKFYYENYSIHRNFEKGIISEKEFLNIALDVCEHAVDEITFCRIYSEVFTVNQDVVSLLPRLKKNYKLFLLSNTNSIHREYGYKQYEFLNYFDKQFLSYEVGAYKPEPEIYKAVESFSKLPSNEHIFIDDVQDYIDGAKLAGWDGIRFLNYEQLINDLKLRNIII